MTRYTNVPIENALRIVKKHKIFYLAYKSGELEMLFFVLLVSSMYF